MVTRRCHGQLLAIFMHQNYLSCEAYSNIRNRKQKYLLGMVPTLPKRNHWVLATAKIGEKELILTDSLNKRTSIEKLNIWKEYCKFLNKSQVSPPPIRHDLRNLCTIEYEKYF
ncbi:unnamed protein product [Meloidogyne enterolobii]|uniref:Uncharacterized protein n=1 Tax=Meloidogyne enterolobii TaxID=390850 RepID=A0ACB1AR05_MELEN